MSQELTKTKIEVNKNSLRIPIYVIRSGKAGLTITCADSKYGFKFGTSARAASEVSSQTRKLIL